jgi:formate hydrogenlyase subunit 3/multisubunit Na+/H+ antiporter MnhD subunit
MLVILLLREYLNGKIISSLLFILSSIGIWLAINSWSCSFDWTAPSPIYLGVAPLAIKTDRLSSLFLGILFVVTSVVAIFSPGYLKHLQGRISLTFYWLLLFLFVFSMGAVLVSSNALTFLLFWEIMSLSSGGLVAIDIASNKAQRATIIYLGATRIATAFLAAGFIWAYYTFGSWSFADWQLGGFESMGMSLLILIGFAIKAGLWPFHIWLPYAHPTAPAPISALMSSVMIKIPLYGLIRLFVYQNHCSSIICTCLIVLGIVSAVWGVLFALVQHDLKRLLAYSSVENVGLIALSIGLSIYGKCFALDNVANIALIAALFHCCNHALFKSLLFLGAGAIDAKVHTRELSQLGGLSRAMPWTMACFFIGGLAISALPPLNGFISKWLVYQSLFQITISSKNVVHISIALAITGVLSVVGGLAIACFTKAVGICFLGKARSHSAKSASECTNWMIVSQLLLALGCLVVGLDSAQIANLLALLAPGKCSLLSQIQLPMLHIGIILILFSILIYLLFLQNKQSIKKYSTWDCGYGRLTAHMQTTAESFIQPIASLLSPILQYNLNAKISGKDRRHFPEHIKAEAVTRSLLELKIYGPIVSTVQWLSRHMARLQAGSIHFYLLYLLLSVVFLIAVGVVQ